MSGIAYFIVLLVCLVGQDGNSVQCADLFYPLHLGGMVSFKGSLVYFTQPFTQEGTDCASDDKVWDEALDQSR